MDYVKPQDIVKGMLSTAELKLTFPPSGQSKPASTKGK
jgi:hypothetical protein